jgi:hypothetical protein
MSINLKQRHRASTEDISNLEAVVQCQLSAQVLRFFNEYDGAVPDSNIFSVAENIESGVNQFIPCNKIPDERGKIENIGSCSYPIAWAEGGNYVCIDENQGGAVFFWDHEAPDLTHKLSSDIQSFLGALRPFDASSVKLAPGQVKKAWIDPEFLKSLSKKS